MGRMSTTDSLGLIPSARDLYFILHDILCFDYEIIPQLYTLEDKQCIDRDGNESFHMVLYILSCSYFDEQERNQMNLEKMITAGIRQNKSLQFLQNNSIIDNIIQEIARLANNKPFEFDKSVLSETELNQLTFNTINNTVMFDNPSRDFINIISEEHVLEGDYNDECRIDTFILGRRSEMWIGIISKAIYGPYAWVENEEKALFYYYRSRIQGFGETTFVRLSDDNNMDKGSESDKYFFRIMFETEAKSKFAYDKYDWISFVVNKTKKTMTFYKNQKKIVENHRLIEANDLVYNGVVDARNDGFFVEKVLFGLSC